LAGYFIYKLYVRKELIWVNVLLLAFAYFLQNSTFFVLHYQLAMLYEKISKDIPMIIDEKPVTDAYLRRQQMVSRVLLICNIVFPLISSVFLYFFDR
jgi:hypothetical protein